MKKVILSYLIHFIWISALIILIKSFPQLVQEIRKGKDSNLFLLVGSGILLAGTLGYLSTWDIQSFCGKTTPEKLNKTIFILCYVTGTTIIMLFSS